MSNKRSGQALIEVLVAISVLTVGFLGIVSLLSRALSMNRVVSDSYTATYLASEGVEVAKNILDGNDSCWNCGFVDGDYELDSLSDNLTQIFNESNPRKLKFDSQLKTYGYGNGEPTSFVRKVSVYLVSDQEIRINSEVRWATRGGGASSINVEDHFYNW